MGLKSSVYPFNVESAQISGKPTPVTILQGLSARIKIQLAQILMKVVLMSSNAHNLA